MTPPPELDDRSLASATARVIRSLAEAGGYVILGRGAQSVLAEREDAFHVSLVGDPEDRARRIMNSQHVDRREAEARCARVDGERAAYVRRYYGRHIADPLLYDVVLNTSRLGLSGATAVATAAARTKLGL